MVLRLLTTGSRSRSGIVGLFIALLIAVLIIHHIDRAESPLPPGQTLHQLHIAQNEMNCTDCHGLDSETPIEKCASCHDASEIEQRFDTFKNEIGTVEANQEKRWDFGVFSHELHPKTENCEQCHSNAVQLGKTPYMATLSMQVCMDCHRKSDGPLECSRCHSMLPILPPMDHTQDWQRAHGAVAQNTPSKCTLCHEESFCQECHEGNNITTRIHPLNWDQTHSFSAKGQEEDCLVCHQTRDECVACHRQRNVLPHPLGSSWADPVTGGDHTTAADNLESCLDCHDMGNADPVCVKCHK
jgi:hypothetical protein